MEDKRISVGKHGGISDNFSIGIKSPATEKTTIGNNATAAHNKRGLMNKGSSQIIRVQPLESSLNSNGNGAADIAPKLPPKPVREQAHVLFSYDAQNEDELTIKEGEIITIISKENEDAGWWKGELNGRIALFPDNFVKIIKPSVPPPLPPVDSDKVRIKKPDRAVDSTVSPTSSMTGSSSPSVVSHLLGKKSKYPSLNTTTTINNSNNIAQSNNTPTAQSSAASSSNGPSSKLNDSGSDNLLTNDEPKSPSLKDEQNNLFSAELHSPSKLVHLTALRPKIPVNSRRPPSLCIPKEFGDPFENGIGGDFSEPDSPQSEAETSSVPSSSASVRVRPTPAASNRTDPTTTTQSTTTNNSNTSSPAKAPWVMELKKAQERRKGGGTNDKNNSDANNTNPDVLPPSPSIKPLAPSLPGAKPLVSKSNKPGLSQQTPNEPGEQPQPGMVGIKSVVIPGGRQSAKISSSQQHSTPTQSTQNVSGVAIPSQSNTSSVTSTSNGPISSSVTFSSAGDSSSPLLINNINNKASSSSSSSNATNDEVAKLRKEMAEMRKEWSQEKAELSSQITELKELIESHKKYLPGVVKELINELAEEKKKTANILIELDRLRKLNTTV